MPITGPGSATPLQDYDTTTPAAPTSGVLPFSRNRARHMLATIGPSGQDTSLQPALFANRIARLNAINNVVPPIYDGLSVATVNAATAVAVASSSVYNAMVRSRYSTTTTASTGGGVRSATAQWFFSSTANIGGFFFVARFGIAVVPSTTQTRWFVGLSSTTGALSPTTDPTALLNLIGFGANAADTNMRVLWNAGTGTATSTDLGANFPAKTAGTNFYEVRLFSPSAAGLTLYWSAQRINDGASIQGGPVTTNLPALGTLLAAHVNIGNGTQAATASIDVQSLYVETDN